MTLRQKLKQVLATFLILTISLSACGASLKIKTWFLNGDDPNHSQEGLIRRNDQGVIAEHMAFLAAHGYLCYSPSDDEAWRQRMNLCCNAAGL